MCPNLIVKHALDGILVVTHPFEHLCELGVWLNTTPALPIINELLHAVLQGVIGLQLYLQCLGVIFLHYVHSLHTHTFLTYTQHNGSCTHTHSHVD